MKYGVIKYDRSLNYGDDIQTIAAARLLPKVDYFLDREHLNNPNSSEKVKLITNGWFMDHPENWPPSENINPLFISFHITHHNNSIKLLTDKKYFDYYKKHEPIGCRDYHTVELFKNIGIQAYFSGCLTMTLQNTKDFERNEEIIFVDAINGKLPKRMRDKIFNKLVPNSIKDHIVFESHFHSDIHSTEFRFRRAEQLLDRYAKAHLIVTSRIHVALPALALGTPVLFLDLGFNTAEERNRFGGLIEYFNVLDEDIFPFTDNSKISSLYKKLKLYNIHYPSKQVNFDWENPVKPSGIFKEKAEEMRFKIKEFIKE